MTVEQNNIIVTLTYPLHDANQTKKKPKWMEHGEQFTSFKSGAFFINSNSQNLRN